MKKILLIVLTFLVSMPSFAASEYPCTESAFQVFKEHKGDVWDYSPAEENESKRGFIKFMDSLTTQGSSITLDESRNNNAVQKAKSEMIKCLLGNS